MTREKLLKEEEKSFRDFLDDLHSRNAPGSLSHYEHNLEVSEVIQVIQCYQHQERIRQIQNTTHWWS